jgi:phosphatidylglycerol:prolipoprotein diacylglycerol transferase
MFPVLLERGPFQVRAYGVALTASFVIGMLLAWRRAQREGIEPYKITRVGLVIVLATVIGARLAHLLLNPNEFGTGRFGALDKDGVDGAGLTGLAMNGGVIASVLCVVIYTKLFHMPTWRTLDILAPCLALGLFLTRIGCFLNGCCYGQPTDLPWGVVFPDSCPAGAFQRLEGSAPRTLHPTQLYSAVFGLLILVIMLVLERKYKRFDGFTVCLLFLLYPTARFAVEFLRHCTDEIGPVYGLTANQFVCLALFAGGLSSLLFLARKSRRLERR